MSQIHSKLLYVELNLFSIFIVIQKIEHIAQNAIIPGHDDSDPLQSFNNAKDIDDWMSPSANLRSKRRKVMQITKKKTVSFINFILQIDMSWKCR